MAAVIGFSRQIDFLEYLLRLHLESGVATEAIRVPDLNEITEAVFSSSSDALGWSPNSS